MKYCLIMQSIACQRPIYTATYDRSSIGFKAGLVHSRGVSVVLTQPINPEYRSYTHEKPMHHKGGHSISYSVSPSSQKNLDVNIKRKSYSGYLRENISSPSKSYINDVQHSFCADSQSNRPKSDEKMSNMHTKTLIDGHYVPSHRKIDSGEAMHWKAVETNRTSFTRSHKRQEKDSRMSVEMCVNSLYMNTVDQSNLDIENSTTSPVHKKMHKEHSLSPSLKNHNKHRYQLSLQNIEKDVYVESWRSKVFSDESRYLTSKNECSDIKNDCVVTKKRSSREKGKCSYGESEVFCNENKSPLGNKSSLGNKSPLENKSPLRSKSSLGNKSPLENKSPLRSKSSFGNKSPLENKSPLRSKSSLGNKSPLENRSPLGNKSSLENKSPLGNKSLLYNESRSSEKNTYSSSKSSPNTQKHISHNSSIENVFPNLKSTTVFSIVKEISKIDAADLSLDTLKAPKTSSSFCIDLDCSSESPVHKESPFSAPALLSSQRKENNCEDKNKDGVFGKDILNNSSSFRRSVFGNYSSEKSFENIKSSLKEIIQHNKESKKSIESFSSDSYIYSHSEKNNRKHDSFIKFPENTKDNLFSDFIKRPVSVYNNFKFSNLLYKESQDNPASDLDKSFKSEDSFNMNSFIKSETQDNIFQERLTDKRLSFVASKFMKSLDDKKHFIFKEKNIKNVFSRSHNEKQVENDENLRPDDIKFNITNSNYSRTFSETNKNYNTGILSSNNENKNLTLKSLCTMNSYNNNSLRTKSKDMININRYSQVLSQNNRANYDSNDMTSWLLSMKDKYQNIKIEHEICDSPELFTYSDSEYSSTPRLTYTPRLESNSDFDTFSFSKFGNKSFDTVKKTLASLKKK
ncbi:hypothetical protein PORY_000840 [Pneumocystis oryctolagi]|uniref:Uncharacterized protein n=1 Tax=Pneumocystis oryctolagi TaxID=42067 RepID=A0ACB7CEJ2_9ASCO|nr:hypothetical protein PORY_000840 [Pneumocystis oryctolagi]